MFKMCLMKIEGSVIKIFLIICRIEKIIVKFLLSKKTLANINDIDRYRYKCLLRSIVSLRKKILLFVQKHVYLLVKFFRYMND